MHLDIQIIAPAAATICGAIAAITDTRSRRIPNWLTGSSLLLALLLHLTLSGWRGLLSSLAAAGIAGSIFLVFYLAGGMGAGDVKLIAAVAALTGLSNTAQLLVFTSLFGGVMALMLALIHGRLRQTLFNVGQILVHHTEEGLTPHCNIHVKNAATLRLPYGVAIAAGAFLTFYVAGVQR